MRGFFFFPPCEKETLLRHEKVKASALTTPTLVLSVFAVSHRLRRKERKEEREHPEA